VKNDGTAPDSFSQLSFKLIKTAPYDSIQEFGAAPSGAPRVFQQLFARNLNRMTHHNRQHPIHIIAIFLHIPEKLKVPGFPNIANCARRAEG